MSESTPPGQPGRPEYLEPGAGAAPPPTAGGRGGARRRLALVAGAAIVTLALVGGGAWAAWWWFSSGPQPAEALPADTLGYVAVDLDPEGAQKIEALRTLERFPALEEELGLDSDDDLRERIFESIRGELDCADLDYGDDVQPWLGDRMAVAAVTVADEPAPVFVLQVRDAAEAEDGIDALAECGGGELGVAVRGDWAVVAETDEIAEDVVAAAGESSLADDEGFSSWTERAGDPGFVTAYLSAQAGPLLAELMSESVDPFGMGVGGEVPGMPHEYSDAMPDDEAFQDALAGFEGAAATLRFDDGAVELEVAGSPAEGQVPVYAEDGVAELVDGLPEDTAAVLAIAFPDHWVEQLLERAQSAASGMLPLDDMLDELSQVTGLELPEDLETLLGDAAALSIGGDFDPEVLFNSTDGSGVPIGLSLRGDTEEIEDVLAKLQARVPAGLLESDTEGDVVAVGPDADYRERLLGDGGLGDSDDYADVVREDDASTVFYVNFDAGDWLTELASGDPVAEENLEPLSAVGLSAWVEGEGDDATTHGLLRITTD